MFLALAAYVATILALLVGALVVPDLARILLITAAVIVAAGGVLLWLLMRARGISRLDGIVRLYMQQVEQIHKDFSQHKQLDRQVAALAQFFHEDLGLPSVAVFARRKRGFMLTDTYGVARDDLKAYRVLFRSELETSMEKRESAIAFRKIYPGDGSEGNAAHPFDHAVPVLTGGRCNYFIAFAQPRELPFKLMRPFLLSLADQVGNYKHLDDAGFKHNQSVMKLKQQIDTLRRERDNVAKASTQDPMNLLSAVDRLARIYDRSKLYAAYLKLLAEEFKVQSSVLLLNDSEGRNLTRQVDRGRLPNLPGNFTLPANHPLLSRLSADAPILSLAALDEPLKSDSGIQALTAAGVHCFALLNGSNSRDGYIGLACSPDQISAQGFEVFRTFSRMLGLILDNLSNFEKIEHLSYTDEITGLYNYRYFYKRLQQEMTRAQRFSRHLGLVIFDVDGFKVFNDTYGHQSGDSLLEQLGALLTKSVRSIDIVSRYGGEEFCIVMPDTNAADCANFMERLRIAILNNEFKDKLSAESLRITVSLGGAIYPNDAQRIDRLIYCADMALLQAKSTGKNKSFMFDENLITVKK